ncbi:MAG: His/Gly/Thr/Pro-type tRNA ligase C-terminal domain-containing protein, partial [Planctomycetota bacterium]
EPDLADTDLAFLGHKQAELGELKRWLDAPPDRAGELGEFWQACEELGCATFLEVDRRIVRGLAYYTGIVWEIWDRARELRALAGGGRYDALVARMGGPDLPALGFGMGDVVLGELLRKHDLLPAAPPRLDAYVVPIGDGSLGPARRLVRRLRDAGLRAEAPYRSVRVGTAVKAADGAGARHAYLLGPQELADGKVKRKDLRSGEEETRDLESVP